MRMERGSTGSREAMPELGKGMRSVAPLGRQAML
jgi:hypothetical protein